MRPSYRDAAGSRANPLPVDAETGYVLGMGSKDKGGREAKKPKKDKKLKAAPVTSVIPPSAHATHGATAADKPAK
jgi:hypothetical protein